MSLYENSIRIKGFLGKDAVTKPIANGKIFVSFSVATKSSYKEKQTCEWISQTFWHRIAAFGKPALDANNQQLKKGDYVEVVGELRTSEYAAKSEEKTIQRRSWEVRATSVTKLPAPDNHRDHPDPEPAEEANEAPM
jgi:single-strand DNA-binding protein